MKPNARKQIEIARLEAKIEMHEALMKPDSIRLTEMKCRLAKLKAAK